MSEYGELVDYIKSLPLDEDQRYNLMMKISNFTVAKIASACSDYAAKLKEEKDTNQ